MHAMAEPSLEVNPEELLEIIMTRLDESGDLPIFSASVNRIQLVGSDPDADAMALSSEVLKDTNLTTKVLRLANSSAYNRKGVKISSLSRAIVVLGFETVKTTVLTLKMIDCFQHKCPDIDMNHLLVNSFMSAGLVREMAYTSKSKEAEQSYICGLLHNLGEIIVAYTLPDKYVEMKRLVSEESYTWFDAQAQVLGMPIRRVGQAIVEKWEFPDTVSKTLAPHSKHVSHVIKDNVERNQVLASLTTNMMDLLYNENPTSRVSFAEITAEMAKATGISKDAVLSSLDKSFTNSCELAEEYGLEVEKLIPKADSKVEDDIRDKIAAKLITSAEENEKINFNAIDDTEDEYDEDDGYDLAPAEVSSPEEDGISYAQQQEPVQNTNVLLETLSEVTSLMTGGARINTIFSKILQGMHEGIGFDRATLCLISPDHKSYTSRISAGSDSDVYKAFFNGIKVNPRQDKLSQILMQGGDISIANVDEWADELPEGLADQLNISSFLAAAIHARKRPVGIFFVDKYRGSSAISTEDHRWFMQLVDQARLALKVV